eukprot:6212224-Amphidinium_carterae.1
MVDLPLPRGTSQLSIALLDTVCTATSYAIWEGLLYTSTWTIPTKKEMAYAESKSTLELSNTKYAMLATGCQSRPFQRA